MALVDRASIISHLLPLLVAWRLLNALTLRTFFQPDEYYQALEPAWWMSFGQDKSRAWITWEWDNHLRSASHPALFSVLYRMLNTTADILPLNLDQRANILLAGPKCLQAVIAALADYYTYKLAAQVHGPTSDGAWYTIVLTTASAWNWFVSTRTFSNCLETTLTIIALYNWPFHWALGVDEVGIHVDHNFLRLSQRSGPAADTAQAKGISKDDNVDAATRLRRFFLAASFAVVLRPTNAILWFVLVLATFSRGIWQHGMLWEIDAFVRQGVVWCSTVLALTAMVDRVFYGVWTLPLWHFFKINVLQSLAVFYGNNNWHYYVSQGYPLLLTGALPLAVSGLWDAMTRSSEATVHHRQGRIVLHRLALICIVLPLTLSILSHKEVRFIFPILPALHILAASRMAYGPGSIRRPDQKFPSSSAPRSINLSLAFVLTINVMIGGYVSYVHNSGIMNVPEYLRNQFETRYSVPPTFTAQSTVSASLLGNNLTFAVLMPCHSLPWRSHLQYPPSESVPGISGWALTCEPPLGLNSTQRTNYLDEADVFYENPVRWLKVNMAYTQPAGVRKPGVYTAESTKNHYSSSKKPLGHWINEGQGGRPSNSSATKIRTPRAWPDYLIFFERLEPTMLSFMRESGYGECARFFNSHFHDDWRRTGDVVIWCLHMPKHTQETTSHGIDR